MGRGSDLDEKSDLGRDNDDVARKRGGGRLGVDRGVGTVPDHLLSENASVYSYNGLESDFLCSSSFFA